MLLKNCWKSRIDPATLLIENSWPNLQIKLVSRQDLILRPLHLQPALLHSTLLLHHVFFENLHNMPKPKQKVETEFN